jgi:hypothetical protein
MVAAIKRLRMPMLSTEMIDTMVQKTIAVKTVNFDELQTWRSKLRQSVQYAIQTQRPDERAFFQALLAIVDDGELNLPDDNPYQKHLQQVKDSVAQEYKEHLSDKKLFDIILAMYEYTGAASLREVLRHSGSSEAQIEAIMGQIEHSESKTLLLGDQLDVIIQRTIEVKTIAAEKIESWHENIQQALLIAEEDKHNYEKAFFEAILAILENSEVLLTKDNPYYDYLQVILDAIRHSASKPKPTRANKEQTVSKNIERDNEMSKLPQDMIETMVKSTIDAKTVAQGELDDWRGSVQKTVTLATQNQRVNDKVFFEALLTVLDGDNVILPDDNPYYSHLQTVKDGIQNYEVNITQEQILQTNQDPVKRTPHEPATKPMLPSILIDSMIQTTIRVKKKLPEKLETWSEELQRHMESPSVIRKPEALDFIAALIALLNDDDAILAEQHPYSLHLQEARDALGLEPPMQENVDIQTDTLTSKSTLAEDIVKVTPAPASDLPEDEWLEWVEQNTLAVLTVSAEHLNEWKHVLQNEMMTDEHSIDNPRDKFLKALYNLLHNRLSALDEFNPYYLSWKNLLIQVSRFKSGRRMKPEFLEKCVKTSIRVCTVNIEEHESWLQRLKKFLTLAIKRKDEQESALFQALLDICEERLPAISLDNPYVSELQRIQAEIANFRSRSEADKQAVEEAPDRTIHNPRALKILKLPEPFRSEMIGLLDALDIALRKIPRTQSHDIEIVREEVGRATDEATKNEPDLMRLKIRGDSLKVAAENLESIAPIVNQIAALLLRLGE